MRSGLLALALAFAPTVEAAEDVLVLEDGQVFQGRPLARVDGGVEVTFQNGKVLVPDALVHVALIAGEADFVPADDAEREKQAKGLVPFEGEWIAKKRRDELLEKRVATHLAEVADNIAHREWKDRRKAESKNFRFEYTVPQHVFENYRDRMEAYYQVFARDWKIRPPKNGKLSVCFYSSGREFHRTSGAEGGVLAYFKFVEPYELDAYFERLDETLTEQVLYHEANHYLQKLVDEGFKVPHFPGESLAEYYGASEWDPAARKLTTGLVQEGRLAEIQDDIAAGQWMSLDKLVGEEKYEHYTWGWSLVHFLMSDAGHRDAFKRFFVGLSGGKDVRRTPFGLGLTTVEPEDVLEAFQKYLGVTSDKAFKDLERDWHRYIEDVLLAGLSKRGLEKGAFKALSTGRKLRAKRLFEEAIAAGSSDPLLYHRYAQLLVGEEKARAIEMWRKAVALGPLTGTYWYGLARALEGDDAAEAKRLKALAKEIDPELDEDSFQFEF